MTKEKRERERVSFVKVSFIEIFSLLFISYLFKDSKSIFWQKEHSQFIFIFTSKGMSSFYLRGFVSFLLFDCLKKEVQHLSKTSFWLIYYVKRCSLSLFTPSIHLCNISHSSFIIFKIYIWIYFSNLQILRHHSLHLNLSASCLLLLIFIYFLLFAFSINILLLVVYLFMFRITTDSASWLISI